MTVILTKPKTQIVWRSSTPGDKTTSIPGSDMTNNGYSLDIKTTLGNGDTHFVIPTSGTIGGLPGIQFTDDNCNLFLRSKGIDNDWIIRCLCCYTPTPFVPPPPCTFTWTSQSGLPLNEWYSGTISDDGTVMGVIDSSFPAVYVSTDSGATWQDRTPSGFGLSGTIAASSTGQIMLVGGGAARDFLWLSTNAGASWTQITLTDSITSEGQYGGFGVSMSGNGQKMIVSTFNRGRSIPHDPTPLYMWISTNQGVTWTQQTLTNDPMYTYWIATISRDGSTYFAVNASNGFVSQNNGTTWTAVTNPFSGDVYKSIVVADGGAVILASRSTAASPVLDYVYKSTDLGVTWTPILSLGLGIFGGESNTDNIAISNDGQIIIIGSQSGHALTGPLYASCDGGATWTGSFVGSSPPQQFWADIVINNDGSRAIVLGAGPFNHVPSTATHP